MDHPVRARQDLHACADLHLCTLVFLSLARLLLTVDVTRLTHRLCNQPTAACLLVLAQCLQAHAQCLPVLALCPQPMDRVLVQTAMHRMLVLLAPCRLALAQCLQQAARVVDRTATRPTPVLSVPCLPAPMEAATSHHRPPWDDLELTPPVKLRLGGVPLLVPAQ